MGGGDVAVTWRYLTWREIGSWLSGLLGWAILIYLFGRTALQLIQGSYLWLIWLITGR